MFSESQSGRPLQTVLAMAPYSAWVGLAVPTCHEDVHICATVALLQLSDRGSQRKGEQSGEKDGR